MLENAPIISICNVVQNKHGANIEDQVNDPMEEDDNNLAEDDGTNRLIQDMFARTDQEKFHDIHDVSLLEKATHALYEGSIANILSTTLLSVNLKVLNGSSSTCMT